MKKLPQPRFVVLKKMIHDKKKYYPPRIVNGKLEYDTVQLQGWEADLWNHAGTITDEPKFRKGMLVHPDDMRY